MKRFVMILTLTAVLAVSAMAGDMHGSDSPAPAPTGPPQGISATSPGQTPSAPGDMHGDFAQPISDAALSAFLSVFGLVV